MILVFAIGCSPDAPDVLDTPDDPDLPGDPVPVDVATIVGDGHTGIPLTLTATNHLDVVIDSPAGPLQFYVDSGASVTLISPETAEALGVQGGPTAPVSVSGWSMGGFDMGPVAVVVFDLSAVNAGLQSSGEPPIDGILGAPFLAQVSAIIDYTGPTLYAAAAEPDDGLRRALGDALDDAGYTRIPTSPSPITSFVELDATVDGDGPFNTIVDTGAAVCGIELATATAVGLELVPSEFGAATVNGGVFAYQTTVSRLELGPLVLEDDVLIVLDLGAQNAQLEAAGLSPIELLVGGDLLVERDGVLDYVGDRLFLLP